MIVLIIEIMLKAVGFGMKASERKTHLEKVLLDFKAQYSASVKKNVKIKRRYDEQMEKLRNLKND